MAELERARLGLAGLATLRKSATRSIGAENSNGDLRTGILEVI